MDDPVFICGKGDEISFVFAVHTEKQSALWLGLGADITAP